MRVLCFLLEWWRQFWNPGENVWSGLDSHSWENKSEIYRSLKM